MKRLSCAIYTRKSSDEGLEKEFNSLDAQREACAAFILSQKHAGWACLPDLYDDGGLSGGTMDRPALRRLLSDIQAGKVQIVVVYKVDRLTRSLADFAKIVDVFDAHGASFVSVTQQFNTTTSMGRLTLNMLLSFAQFEREIAGERIRDKIAASKAKGMWMGGNVPLGYDVKDRKLIANEVEAETVRMIFRRYAELGSVRALGHELDWLGVVSKRREGAGGVLAGGNRFSRGALYTLLQNHLYRGEIAHQGNIYPGQHEAIIDAQLWEVVQEKLSGNRQARALGATAEEPSLLAGLIADGSGGRMTPTHAVKKGRRYRYYVSTALITGGRSDHIKGWRIPAGDVEALVLDRLRAFFASEPGVGEALSCFELDASSLRSVFAKAMQLTEEWATLPPIRVRELVRSLIGTVEVHDEKIIVSLKRDEIASALLGDTFSLPTITGPETFELHIGARLHRAGKGIRLVVGGVVAEKPNGQLLALLRDAHATREALMTGRDATIDAMAQRLGIKRDYLSAHLRLTYLAPDIVRVFMSGRYPPELAPTRLLSLCKDLPHDWQLQRAALGFETQ
ncbi:recombinase family protein [Hyphomicrobium sp. MC1]|uniref:recombinase family protein n=1 Tax=Hyphomicrobium sp. (strain MC1) TaxID=717785 RepID=UPI000213ED92|nr:recombinase family protein [Hyphomicrobium sp. MC1]CCB66642.1 putative resolvase [Hyphomicrobium sp. MC1]